MSYLLTSVVWILLFESSVLGIAGLGVYTMIKLRRKHQSSEVKSDEQTEQ